MSDEQRLESLPFSSGHPFSRYLSNTTQEHGLKDMIADVRDHRSPVVCFAGKRNYAATAFWQAVVGTWNDVMEEAKLPSTARKSELCSALSSADNINLEVVRAIAI